LPPGLPFDLINRNMTKKAISQLINVCYRRLGLKTKVKQPSFNSIYMMADSGARGSAAQIR
jgi:DNA-directed RNA polymerase beta' subunit